MITGRERRTPWLLFRPLQRHAAAGAQPDDADLGMLAPLLEWLPPSPPPPGLLARIEQRIDAIERVRPAAVVRPSRGNALRRTFGVALSGALAGAAAVVAVLLIDPAALRMIEGATPLAVLAGEDSRILRVERIAGGRYLRLTHSGAEIAPDRTLELWLIKDGGAPRSLGVLAAKGSVTILPAAVDVRAGDVLALSREPAGGSPEAGPTGPVLISAVVGASG